MADSSSAFAPDPDLTVTARRLRAGATAALALCAVFAAPRDASACGACYSSSSESTVVNDHKMALAISKQRTVLWDQISYSGNPTEFAYVVPVRPGTRVEPSADAWFAALDASTRPIIMTPQSPGYPGGGRGGGGGGGGAGWGGGGGEGDHTSGCGGCMGASTSSDLASASGSADASAAGSADGGAAANREPVDVVEQKVVGPYETLTLRSNEPGALEKWLRAHGFDIPKASDPIIASYVENGFDFLALRLRPDAGVRAIEPIRIVAPGADPTLPLRMMQIGAGPTLGITLWVIGEGRWHPANFPDAVIDFEKLIWDFAQARSNYQELSKAAMRAGDGRAILTEYSQPPDLDPWSPMPYPGQMANPGLAAAYHAACPTADRADAGPPDEPFDAGSEAATDSGDPDAGDPDAEAPDAGTSDAGVIKPPQQSSCDDLVVALKGLHQGDVRVTRLRANLPYAALADTLRLEPTATQDPVDNVHYAKAPGSIQARIARVPANRYGSYALVAATAFVVSRIVRRRRAR